MGQLSIGDDKRQEEEEGSIYVPLNLKKLEALF